MAESRGKIHIEDEVLREGFVQVPILLLHDPSLSAGAKLAYAGLLWYAWKYGEYPGHEEVAKDYGTTTRTIKRYMSELQHQDYITARQRGLGKTNEYIVHSLGDKIVTSRGTNMSPSGGQEHPHKNELDSNINTNDEDESLSLAKEVGERYGTTPRDRQALASSLSKYPVEAISWGAEELERQLEHVENPAAYLNALVPALAAELAERQRDELTEREERLYVVRAIATIERQAGYTGEKLRERLVEAFHDEELVDEALAGSTGSPQEAS